jgi:hypothetical protein
MFILTLQMSLGHSGELFAHGTTSAAALPTWKVNGDLLADTHNMADRKRSFFQPLKYIKLSLCDLILTFLR